MTTISREVFEENIKDFQRRLEAAAHKANISPSGISVVAVTKYVDSGMVDMASKMGFDKFGEGKVQDFLKKYETLQGKYDWHFIGHLQTNKVKYILDKVDLIHSVDSLELLNEIDRCAKKRGIVSNILFQVNVSLESTKYGFNVKDINEMIYKASDLKHVRVRGLMTMAPFTDNREIVRQVFRDLRKIFVDMKKENVNNVCMDFLSMGMSNDFEIAVEEGANIIRVGTILFGSN